VARASEYYFDMKAMIILRRMKCMLVMKSTKKANERALLFISSRYVKSPRSIRNRVFVVAGALAKAGIYAP